MMTYFVSYRYSAGALDGFGNTQVTMPEQITSFDQLNVIARDLEHGLRQRQGWHAPHVTILWFTLLRTGE